MCFVYFAFREYQCYENVWKCLRRRKKTHTLTFLSVVIWWSELGFCSNRKLIRLRAHLLKSLYALVNILQVLVHCCKVQLHFAIFMSNAAVFFLSLSSFFLFLAFALFTCVQVMYMLKTEMCRQCWVSQIVVAFIFTKTKLENTSNACLQLHSMAQFSEICKRTKSNIYLWLCDIHEGRTCL